VLEVTLSGALASAVEVLVITSVAVANGAVVGTVSAVQAARCWGLPWRALWAQPR
jgi:peroxiredoxin family protein